MRTCACAALIVLVVSAAAGVEPADEARDLAVIRAEMERISPATPVVITMSYHEYENGIIGSARVQLADILLRDVQKGRENVVIKRFAVFDKWKQPDFKFEVQQR